MSLRVPYSFIFLSIQFTAADIGVWGCRQYVTWFHTDVSLDTKCVGIKVVDWVKWQPCDLRIKVENLQIYIYYLPCTESLNIERIRVARGKAIDIK